MRDRPYVVVHSAVTLDGHTDGFEPDVAVFYDLAARWNEDVTLAGADTILAQEETLAAAPRPGANPGGPLLAVVDGRRRVAQWDALRECGHWRAVTGLHAPAGRRRVDLPAALRDLGREHGAEVVRVDSGGALVGALLESRLVDEVSLVIHPCIAGRRAWTGAHDGGVETASLLGSETLPGGLVWSRYRLGR